MAEVEQVRRAQVVPITDGAGERRRRNGRAAGSLLTLIYFISFFCGLAQCFEGVFLPEFKAYFHLSYQQQMYIVFAKNLPFVAAPAVGWLVLRQGYKNILAVAMFLYAAGTWLLVPGLRTENYWLVLAGFMIIGGGFTFQMVTANPLMGALGPPEDSSSRLNFGNSLGAIAQIIAPAALTLIVPAIAVSARDKMVYIESLFQWLGIALVAVAVATTLFPDAASARVDSGGDAVTDKTPRIWRNRSAMLSFVMLFLLLGVEASLFSFFRNYLEAPEVAGLSSHASQRLFTLYFASFALGRLMASGIQRRMRPALQMEIHLFAAVVCVTILIFAKGTAAVAVFLALGLLVSIFFPTFYAITMESAGKLAPQLSALLTVGFLGCAIVPVVQGALADKVGLSRSFGMCAAVYLLAGVYLLSARNREIRAIPLSG
jgi:MFS transporter, FHS family, L-fucose permease